MFAVKLHQVLKDQATKSKLGEVELVISALAENSKDVGFPGITLQKAQASVAFEPDS